MKERTHNRWPLRLAIAIVVAILLLNGIAWMQARAMTKYAEGGEQTRKPEELSLPERAWTIITGVTVPRPRNLLTPADKGLAYDVRTISMGDAETLEAWHVPLEAETDSLVLMFPGYALSKDSLLTQANAIHRMGYAVLIVDYRGVGGSTGSDTTLGVRESKDVAAAVEYARKEWPGRSLVLYGVSMGTASILRAVAKEGVRPDGIILESPFDNLLHTVRNRFGSMDLPAWPGAELILFWGGIQHGFDPMTHNPTDYARAVTAPTLLMHGEHDPRATMEQARAVYRRLGGPKWFVEFKGAGHEALIGVDGERWEESIREMLHSLE